MITRIHNDAKPEKLPKCVECGVPLTPSNYESDFWYCTNCGWYSDQMIWDRILDDKIKELEAIPADVLREES